MSPSDPRAPAYVGRKRPDALVRTPPRPGQGPMLLAALWIGLLLLALQLWMLTVALDLYLAGEGRRVWQLFLASLGIFVGGLLTLFLLRGRPPRLWGRRTGR